MSGDPEVTAPGGAARLPGDRLMRAGVWVTGIGMALTLVAMLPLVLPSLSLPPVFWWLAMVTGVGLTMVLVGLLRAARARGRRITAEVERITAP